MIQVQLTPWEVDMAASVGVHRRTQSMRSNLTSAENLEGKRWQVDAEGAVAELAVAKALNRYWGGGVNMFKDPDVAPNIQVRSSEKSDGNLIIRPKDPEDHLYVLVTGAAPCYTVHGYIQGATAKAERSYMKNPGGIGAAWFVPRSALRPIEDLVLTPAPISGEVVT